MLSSCIERYDIPKSKYSGNYLVVDATINNLQPEQLIRLSYSSKVKFSEYKPCDGCQVEVTDLDGNIYSFDNIGQGEYVGIIGQDNFYKGNGFKINIITPESDVYESEFDSVTVCADIEPVYYEIKNKGEFFEGEQEAGAQFYIDLRADNKKSRYYKWEFEEDWEYHSTFPIQYIYEGRIKNSPLAPHSRQVCYQSAKSDQIYLTSTKYLEENTYLKYPLNYIDNRTQKLYYRYSMKVYQYSISEKAYDFWNMLAQNVQTDGSLFDGYPINVKGNISCVSNPDKKVLGGFWVSQASAKRFFFNDFEGLEFPKTIFCEAYEIDAMAIYMTPVEAWPLYLIDGEGSWLTASAECFDCTAAGGSLTEPGFWKENVDQ
jgi:hypothetical protein